MNVNNQMNFPETTETPETPEAPETPESPESPIPEPGGFTAISRGLRSNATTPPDRPPHTSCIPEGCQP